MIWKWTGKYANNKLIGRIPIPRIHRFRLAISLCCWLLCYSFIYRHDGSSLTSRKDGMAFQQVLSSHEPENNNHQPKKQKNKNIFPNSFGWYWLEVQSERGRTTDGAKKDMRARENSTVRKWNTNLTRRGICIQSSCFSRWSVKKRKKRKKEREKKHQTHQWHSWI